MCGEDASVLNKTGEERLELKKQRIHSDFMD